MRPTIKWTLGVRKPCQTPFPPPFPPHIAARVSVTQENPSSVFISVFTSLQPPTPQSKNRPHSLEALRHQRVPLPSAIKALNRAVQSLSLKLKTLRL